MDKNFVFTEQWPGLVWRRVGKFHLPTLRMFFGSGLSGLGPLYLRPVDPVRFIREFIRQSDLNLV